ncbi:hypothetical protein CHARACLAT_021611 [Characodon lateralis]|uniref:PARP4 MVP-ID C-terminal domain-containing protein n=1 Tax=Characodon lateralis TaxID=208331 RepID=A0ABU7D8W9_9TELE|nr:hypothetical protein [Characodon lateralis]
MDLDFFDDTCVEGAVTSSDLWTDGYSPADAVELDETETDGYSPADAVELDETEPDNITFPGYSRRSCSLGLFSSDRPFSFGLPAPTGFHSEHTGPGAAPQVSSRLGSASKVNLQSAFTIDCGLFGPSESLRRIDSALKLHEVHSFSAPLPPPPPAKCSDSLQAPNIPPPPHIPVLYQMNLACIMDLSSGGGSRASEAMRPRQPFFESSNPDPEELRLKWTKIFQLQHADGYWELTIELGELVNFNIDSFANVFLKNKGIYSLGVKAHADILKLVATLLVLQLMRMEKLEEGKLLQSLFCLKEPSQSRSERWEQVKKAVEWVCKADREYPCICSRLEFGWSWESSTRQLLGFERLPPFSPLISLDLQKTTAPRLLY